MHSWNAHASNTNLMNWSFLRVFVEDEGELGYQRTLAQGSSTLILQTREPKKVCCNLFHATASPFVGKAFGMLSKKKKVLGISVRSGHTYPLLPADQPRVHFVAIYHAARLCVSNESSSKEPPKTEYCNNHICVIFMY